MHIFAECNEKLYILLYRLYSICPKTKIKISIALKFKFEFTILSTWTIVYFIPVLLSYLDLELLLFIYFRFSVDFSYCEEWG